MDENEFKRKTTGSGVFAFETTGKKSQATHKSLMETQNSPFYDDRETMRPVEFMQKSLQVLHQRMTTIESKIEQTKKIIDAQPAKIKEEID